MQIGQAPHAHKIRGEVDTSSPRHYHPNQWFGKGKSRIQISNSNNDITNNSSKFNDSVLGVMGIGNVRQNDWTLGTNSQVK